MKAYEQHHKLQCQILELQPTKKFMTTKAKFTVSF